MSRRRQPGESQPVDPRVIAEGQGYDMGSLAVAVVVEVVAVGTRDTIKRARRADPLNRVDGCTAGMRTAAAIYRQSVEHIEAGRGMGPLPYASDGVQEHRRGDGTGVELMAQERALSAADWHRRGVQAMGLAASQGVVHWVVVAGLPLASYDETRKWRKGTGCGQMLAALERLAGAYKCT